MGPGAAGPGGAASDPGIVCLGGAAAGLCRRQAWLLGHPGQKPQVLSEFVDGFGQRIVQRGGVCDFKGSQEQARGLELRGNGDGEGVWHGWMGPIVEQTEMQTTGWGGFPCGQGQVRFFTGPRRAWTLAPFAALAAA